MDGLVKITKDCYVPRSQIKFFAVYNMNSIRSRVKVGKAKGTVLDLCGGKKILTAVFLVTGEIILVNTAAETISQRFEPKGGA